MHVACAQGCEGLTGFPWTLWMLSEISKELWKNRCTSYCLTKKTLCLWNMEAQQAFDALKVAMTSVPVLALPDFSITFIVETDASGSRLGVILMQEGCPHCFY